MGETALLEPGMPQLVSPPPPAVDKVKSEPLPQEPLNLSFPLSGNGLNLLVDACGSLTALFMRLYSLDSFEGADALCQQVNNQIRQLDAELRAEKIYDEISILVCRYVLCAALDEVVARKAWSKGTQWEQKRLLTTHCGLQQDAFPRLLPRLLANPEKYRDVLELSYLFLAFGYREMPGEDANTRTPRQEMMGNIKAVLGSVWRQQADNMPDPYENVEKTVYQVEIDLPHWPIYVITLVTLFVIYLVFQHLFDVETQAILKHFSLLPE